MKGFCPLASGSKGNCLYFGTQNTKILIDAGISGKATEKSLQELDIDIGQIQAVLISHEHMDHIAGLKNLALRRGIPVLANSETAKNICAILNECPQFKIFTTGEPFTFGDIEILPFSIPHDTTDPVAFTLKTGSLKMGVCTDLGFVTSLIQIHLKHCDYLYLEANHQPDLVQACRRPLFYKQRVLGRNGHLSNEDCGNLLSAIAHPQLKHVYLAHLSEECNTPQISLEVVRKQISPQYQNLPLSIAPQKTRGETLMFTE